MLEDCRLCGEQVQVFVSITRRSLGIQKRANSIAVALILIVCMNFYHPHNVEKTFPDNKSVSVGMAGINDIQSSWNRIWEKAELLSVQDEGHAGKATSNSTHTTQTHKIKRGFDRTALNATLTSITQFSAKDVFDYFPSPVKADTIQIYNERSYQELITVFTKKQKQQTIICANGGSATAGGGHIQSKNRYPHKLAKYIHELQLNTAGGHINVLKRGHGGRNSLHSAVFAPNMFPHDMDVLLWEFAINDYGYNLPQDQIIQQQRSIFIVWLREVEKRNLMSRSRPTKVILVYLWKAPFEWNEYDRVNNPVYEAHKYLAKEFDFVVGHVNVASYFDELSLSSRSNSPLEMEIDKPSINEKKLQKIFLADAHHPNEMGHLATAFLLLNLLRGRGEWKDSRSRFQPTSIQNTKSMKTAQTSMENLTVIPHVSEGKVDKYKWYCGTETAEKRFVKSQVVNESGASSGWISPVGTATLELPRNPDDGFHVLKQMVFDLRSKDKSKSLAKEDPLRDDRIIGISVACCTDTGTDTNISANDYTTVRIRKDNEAIRSVKALFLGFALGLSDVNILKVKIGSKSKKHNINVDVNGKLVKVPSDWPCFWSWKAFYDSMWFDFAKEQHQVSSIHVCVENDKCENDSQGGSGAMLISMAIY